MEMEKFEYRFELATDWDWDWRMDARLGNIRQQDWKTLSCKKWLVAGGRAPIELNELLY